MSSEEALEKAALRFASIIESSDVAIYSQDLDGVITGWNAGAETLFGYRAAEIVGKKSYGTIIPPNRRAEEEDVLERTRAGHGVQHHETVRQRKDGTLFDVSITISPVRNSAGEIVGVSKIARDVTVQKRIEQDARELAAIVESSEDSIISKNLDGTILSWNRAAEQMFGFAAAEAIGRSILMIIPDDRTDEEEDVLRRIRRGEAVRHFETVRRRKDGTLLSVSMTASPIRSEDGSVIGASQSARDVTVQQQIEQDARHLAAIVRSSEDAIVGKDLNGTVTSWNRAAEEIFGFSAAEAIGQSIRMIIPDDRQDEEDNVLRHIRQGESVRHFETVRRRKDGTLVPISVTVSPIRRNSTVVGASKIARDISDEKRAAELAAFLTEASHLLAASLDYEVTLKAIANLAVPLIADWCAVDIMTSGGRIERLAAAHADPDKIEIVRTIRECYEDPDSPYSVSAIVRTGRPAIVSHVSDDMLAQVARGDEECLRLLRTLGLTSYIGVPLVAHGRTFGALSFASAESHRNYTAEDLRFAEDLAYRAALAIDNAKAYKEAQFANQLKDDFLATFSHELRTPLNAILGYSRMLQAGTIAPEKQAQALKTVERNATTLSQLVEDVLDVSRIISGKLRLNIQPVDLPAVVKQAVETVRPAADAKQIRIDTIVDPAAAPISGDPDRLQQIVWNLVANAVKFTPKEGRVQVRLERINSHVEISVSDTGIGIKPDFLPHIFERFRQADSGAAREHSGLGLGLGIARHLVELHGGTIHAASGGEGQGATFQVRLPIMIARAASPADRRRVHPLGHAAGPRGPIPSLVGVHVLAVDDDSDALMLGREILEAAGARVTTLESAELALEEIAAVRPDVLVADVGLPRLDGFELMRRIRRLPEARLRDVPAAALTAYARPEDRVKALQSGFQIHLAKPIDPVELVVAVAALAKRAQPPTA
ncbi:MAG TPA: PAS domain S-box protein [Vicinamibacterales bacterium]|nr:PAS domain S-box protein [Vicinamibacterales bacterium]